MKTAIGNVDQTLVAVLVHLPFRPVSSHGSGEPQFFRRIDGNTFHLSAANSRWLDDRIWNRITRALLADEIA